MTKEQIIREISLASEPGKMTIEEALTFCQDIADILNEMENALIDTMNDEYSLEGEDV